jgi:thioredoxin 1
VYSVREAPGRTVKKARIVANSELTLTDQTFDEEIGSASQPVLVDFWAEWCGPCKMVAPILDEIVSEQDGKLRLGKINIDDNMELARRFDVMSIPTMILFKDGEVQLRIVGAKGKGQLLQEITPYL